MASTITQEKVAERIRQCIGDHILSMGTEHGETIATIKVESIDKLRQICTALRDDKILGFDYLSLVTAIDYMTYPEPPVHGCRFEAVYQLFSVEGGHHFRFKVPVPERDGKYYLHSVTPIWRSAEFSENEVWDMFGIDFVGHPDMRRLYMPEDWEGHPLRKDYDLRQGQDYGVIKVKELIDKYDKLAAGGEEKEAE